MNLHAEATVSETVVSAKFHHSGMFVGHETRFMTHNVFCASSMTHKPLTPTGIQLSKEKPQLIAVSWGLWWFVYVPNERYTPSPADSLNSE